MDDVPEDRDEAWFERLFRREVTAVWSYAARRVRDPDDVVSAVFAAAWRHRDRLPDPPRPCRGADPVHSGILTGWRGDDG